MPEDNDVVQIKTGKAVTMLQLLIAVGTIVISIALGYTSSQVKLSKMEDRITQLEKDMTESKNYRFIDANQNKETDGRLDHLEQGQGIMQTQINDIKNK